MVLIFSVENVIFNKLYTEYRDVFGINLCTFGRELAYFF